MCSRTRFGLVAFSILALTFTGCSGRARSTTGYRGHSPRASMDPGYAAAVESARSIQTPAPTPTTPAPEVRPRDPEADSDVPSLPEPTPSNSPVPRAAREQGATTAAGGSLPSEIESTPAREKLLDPPPADEPTPAPKLVEVQGDYRIRPGDELEIIFAESWDRATDYRLLPGDEVRIELLLGRRASSVDPSLLDRTTRLQPDGKIALPHIGLVDAAGATVVDLSKRIQNLYEEIYVDPEVLVTLMSTGDELRELQRAFEASGSRATLVAPDGLITLPYLGAVKAADLRLAEIQNEINERYRRAMPGVAVTVRLAARR